MDRLPITDDDIRQARLHPRVRSLLFANRDLDEGLPVGVRLNLRGGQIAGADRSYRLQTVHAKASCTGNVLGYDAAVSVRNAEFHVDQLRRLVLVSGRSTKTPLAVVAGALHHGPPDFSGVPIEFNPHRHSFFVEVSTQFAVRNAAEVSVFDNRCYAQGVTYLGFVEASRFYYWGGTKVNFFDRPLAL